MRAAEHHITVGKGHTIEIAQGEIIVTTILRHGGIVRCTCRVILGGVTLVTQAIADHFGEHVREVHADAVVLHLVLHLIGEGHNVIYVEIVAIEGIMHRFALNGGIDMLAFNLVILVVTAVDVALAQLPFADILSDCQLLNLHHGVRQQSVVPVHGVDERLFKAEGSVYHADTHFHRGQVGSATHILVEDVILDKTAQRVHAVSQVLETMPRSADILRIYLIIDFTGLVIKCPQVALGNTVFGLQDGVGHDKEGVGRLLRVRHPAHFAPSVRLVVVLRIGLRIPVGVSNSHDIIVDPSGLQCFKISADDGIVTQNVGEVAVRLLNDSIHGLHDTVFDGVVLQLVVNLHQSLKNDHSIAVIVEA